MKTQLLQPVLASGVSLRRVADILRFANALGNEGSSDGGAVPDGKSTPLPAAKATPYPVDFESAVSELFDLLYQRRIRYLLVGGVALLRYVPGRNTEDIDLLLAVESLDALPEIAIEDREEWFARGRFKGLRVDLLFTTNPLFRAVQERHSTLQRFLELPVPCATPQGLLLLKLYALPSLYRQGDIQRANLYESDITALLFAVHPRLEPLFEELSAHVSANDLIELRKIVAEAQAREKRFGDRE